MRPLDLCAVTAILLTGCHGGSINNSAVSTPEALGRSTTAQIQTINESRNNTLSGVQAAFTHAAQSSTGGQTPNAKVKGIADLIQAGGCTQTLLPPAERFDKDWTAQWEVQDQANGTTCPLYVYESSSFSNSDDQWMENKTWTIKSTGLKSLAGIDALSERGSLTASSSGNMRSIRGQIHYSPYNVTGVGAVSADIVASAKYTGLAGSGQIVLTVFTGVSQTVARIYWQGDGSNPYFQVNGVNTDEKSFVALFSSFELTEIMDRVLKMR